MVEIGERKAVIAGIGQSDVGRRLERLDIDLTLEACLAAIADAGLTRADIDGLASYPGSRAIGPGAGSGSRFAGFSGPSTPEVQDALRLNLDWHAGGSEGPGQFGAVINAIAAVATGYCQNVLVYRTVTESSQTAELREQATRAAAETGRPARAPSTAWGASMNGIAGAYQRHMHEFGTTREQLGALAINSRRNAGLNPNAIFRDPLTMDDYLGARMIYSPLGLFDCDVPCDGSTAFVVARADTAVDAPHPVHIQAIGSAIRGRPSFEHWEDFTTFSCRDAAQHMWSRTDLRASDVDVLELYDGFSFLTLAWVEALGFAERGGGGPFLASGEIALEGRYPLNTHGGQLSQGRLHGFGFLHEACVQLRGEGGPRQVADAAVAVAAAGGGPLCGSILLTRTA